MVRIPPSESLGGQVFPQAEKRLRLRIEGFCLLFSEVWKVQGRGGAQSTYHVDCVRLAGAPLGVTGPCLCHQLTEGKMMERRKKIALELSELVVYCRPVPFDEESKSRGPVGLVFGCCPWGV